MHKQVGFAGGRMERNSLEENFSFKADCVQNALVSFFQQLPTLPLMFLARSFTK
jgi:hypothetical protein